MTAVIDFTHLDSEYLTFEYSRMSTSGKTFVVDVLSRNGGEILGEIKWYGAWRQYTFMPAQRTIFNKTCLEVINSVLDYCMVLHKNPELKCVTGPGGR